MAEQQVVEGEIIEENALMVATGGAIQQIEKAAIDTQIATAKRYPRNMTQFTQKLMTFAKSNKELAAKCMYRKPQAGGFVTGPSIRFAEMAAQAWGNMRIASRIIEIGGERVVAQGVVLDLETNIAESIEVPMSIVTKQGKRYGSDMIDTIAKAAQAKARRDAILATIPRALWSDVMDEIQKVAAGTIKTLEEDRKVALDYAKSKYSVDSKRVLAALGCKSDEDLDVEKLVLLRGMLEALRDGESTVEMMFPDPKAITAKTDKLADKIEDKQKPAEEAKAAEAPKEAPKQKPEK